jgi:hypothetical protein
MKIAIDLECTPEEARHFLGLPDVRGMQEELIRQFQQRMSANIQTMTPEALLKMWMPATVEGLEQWRTLFSQMTTGRK